MLKLGPPVGKQARSIAEATARFNLWHGAVRSSKTIGSLIAFLDYVATTENDNLLIGGKTERTLRRNIITPLQQMLGPNVLNVSWGLGEAYLWDKTLLLMGAHDKSAEEKIRGVTSGGGYLDELTTWPQEVFEMFRSRCSMPNSKMFATTNPDSPNHWVRKELLLRKKQLDMASWSFNIDNNPYLDPEFVVNLKREYVGLWYKRFIQGLWVAAEGAIWDMFCDDHVVSHLPKMLKYWVAVDYGTVNPFHAVLIGLSSPESDENKRSRLYVCKEWRWASQEKHRQKTDAEYSKAVRTWLGSVRPAAWFVDPSAASFMLQLRRDKAHRVQGADNAVLDGIRSVATLLSNDLLRIHESCEGLIQEVYGYVWDDKAQEKGEDKPMKVDDHGPDAVRYGVRMLTSVWQNWVRDLGSLAPAA